MHCVKGPVVVDNLYLPAKASPVTIENYHTYMAEGSIALIEFYSEKCQACASLAWVIDSIHVNFSNRIFIGANNTDGDTLCKKLVVPVVPTYVLFKNGKEMQRRSYIANELSVYDTLIFLLKQLLTDTGDTHTPPDTESTVIPPDTMLSDYCTLDESTFDATVLRSGVTAMVFFLYSGGAPCIYMDSVIRELAPRYKDKAVIAKVHAWENMNLCNRYGINYVPQYFFFKDGIQREELWHDALVPGDTLAAILSGLINEKQAAK